MERDEAGEAELRELVARIDRLVPKEDAHVTIPGEGEASTIGNRRGYLRLGVELLAAALDPRPGSAEGPPRIEPRLDYLLSEGSRAPFDICEVDEAIASRPPVASGLGAAGQLSAGVLVVAVLILAFIGAALVFRWLFG
jgi:hypothetical protein